MDKYEVAKTIGEEFNYPWIEEMNCFDGFPEVLKKEDGTDIEGCDWYMGEGLNDYLNENKGATDECYEA